MKEDKSSSYPDLIKVTSAKWKVFAKRYSLIINQMKTKNKSLQTNNSLR